PDRVVTDPGDRRGAALDRGLHDLLGPALVVVHVLHLAHAQLGAAAELDAEVEPLAEQADHRQAQQDQGDDVEPPAATDDVERPLARVEVVAELAETRHQTTPPSSSSRVWRRRPGASTSASGSGSRNWPRPR